MSHNQELDCYLVDEQQNNIVKILEVLDNTHRIDYLNLIEEQQSHLVNCLKAQIYHQINNVQYSLIHCQSALESQINCDPCLKLLLEKISAKQICMKWLRKHKLIEIINRETEENENNSVNHNLESEELSEIQSLDRDKQKSIQKYQSTFEEICNAACHYSIFLQQIKQIGGKFKKIKIEETSQSNRRIIAKETIKKDEQIIFIPKIRLITLELTRELQIVKNILQSKAHLRSPKHTQIAIYLLLQEEKGQNSIHYSYISKFPSNFCHFPVKYTDDEMKQLEGTSFIEQIQQRRLDLTKDYQAVVNIDNSFSRFSFNNFIQKRLLVSSRIFGIVINKCKTDAMVPVADMLNHQLPKQTSWYYCDTTEGFVIKSLKEIQMGSQVFDSYGQKCNSRFLLNYGFTVSNNLANEVNINIPLLAHLQNNFNKTITTRVSKNIETRSFDELISILRFVVKCSQEGFETQGCKQQDDDLQLSLQTIRHTPFEDIQIEKCSWQLLQQITSNQLKQYHTNLKQDRRLLLEGNLSTNMVNIINLRKGEKQILHYYLQMSKRLVYFLKNRSKTSDLKPYERYLESINIDLD